MELDVQVAVLIRASVLWHALVCDALPRVWLDHLSGCAGDLQDPVIQVLDGEGGATKGLCQCDLLQIEQQLLRWGMHSGANVL